MTPGELLKHLPISMHGCYVMTREIVSIEGVPKRVSPQGKKTLEQSLADRSDLSGAKG